MPQLPRLFLTIALLLGLHSAVGQTIQPFFAPAQSSGVVEVQLCPMENVIAGNSTLVTFGIPFSRGSITPALLSNVRILNNNAAEIPAHVEVGAYWRSTNPNTDQKWVRFALIQLHYAFQGVFPEQTTIRVEWGGAPRVLDIPTLEDPKTAWHLANSGSFEAADNVFEPDVYALLPRETLCNGALKLTRMLPYNPGVPPAREDPNETDVAVYDPVYLEMDHAQHNFLFTLNNDDDPLVTTINQIPYKTDFEPWLYDRSAAMYLAYTRSGFLYDLRQAVRNEQFYLNHLYAPGTAPDYAVGLFDLKVPDPTAATGGNSSMYSYAECLAYTNWLTGDPKSLEAIDWVVNAHEKQTEPPRWSPTAPAWTERHTAFRLLANAIGFEATGNTTYRDSMLQYADAFVWHQNGAGGQIPANAIPGGLYHFGNQHGDGAATDYTASSWMSVLTQEAMIRVFALTEKAEFAEFIRKTGYFFNAATKFDDQHIYDTFEDGAPLWYPDYMMLWNGATDERDGSEIEHSLEIADAAAWAAYFSFMTGQQDTAFVGLAKRLYFSYDQGVNHWTRPLGPSAGKAAFRITPPRKYGWEYRPSGSFTWLMAQFEGGMSPAATLPSKEKFWTAVATNPMGENLNIQLDLEEPGLVSVQLYDLQGKLLLPETKRDLTTGKSTWDIPVVNLPPGAYILAVRFGGSLRTCTLSKI